MQSVESQKVDYALLGEAFKARWEKETAGTSPDWAEQERAWIKMQQRILTEWNLTDQFRMDRRLQGFVGRCKQTLLGIKVKPSRKIRKPAIQILRDDYIDKGKVIPSVRQLSREYDWSGPTFYNAFAQLKAQGYTERVLGDHRRRLAPPVAALKAEPQIPMPFDASIAFRSEVLAVLRDISTTLRQLLAAWS